MASVINSYDTLYDNLKNRFTVVCEGCECTLGDYMLIKAGKRQTPKSDLPATTVSEKPATISDIVDYVASQLTVKTAPVRERTIRRFPLRSSMSAIFTAAAACALVFSFGIFTLNSSGMLSSFTANSTGTEEVADNIDAADSAPQD